MDATLCLSSWPSTLILVTDTDFCQLIVLLSRVVSVKRENVDLLETNSQTNKQQKNNSQCMIFNIIGF